MREIVASPVHDRARGLGYLAAAWIEHFCVHGPGDVQDAPLDPELPGSIPLGMEMLGFVADVYGLDDQGRRLYGSAFVSRAKGWAKSELAGFLVLFEAFGPCRFTGWAQGGEKFAVGSFEYVYEPGEAMGKPVTYAFIRCLATEEGQAGNTFDNVYSNLGGYGLGSKRLIDAYRIGKSDVGLSKIKLPDGGEIVPSTASSSAKDGGKESFVVFDETHLYVTPELHRMYRVVSRNLTKRYAAEPWALETSTMYGPGEGSVAELTHTHAKKIREGKDARATNTFFDHLQAPMETKVDSRESLRAAIVTAYGDAASYTDIDRKVESFFDPRNPIAEQRRYTLNQPTAASDAWLTAVDWERGLTEGAVLRDGDTITLGFDGSQKRAIGIADATALIACRVSDGCLFALGVWEQPEGPEGEDWQIDTDAVDYQVELAHERFKVVGFYGDPPLWQETVARWENTYGTEYLIKASKTAIAWWTNRETLMGRALDLFEAALKDGELHHDGDSVLGRHALNARRRPRRAHMGIGKDHPKSAKKIDAAVAAVLAFQARLDYIAQAPALKTRRKSRISVLT